MIHNLGSGGTGVACSDQPHQTHKPTMILSVFDCLLQWGGSQQDNCTSLHSKHLQIFALLTPKGLFKSRSAKRIEVLVT